MPFTDLKNIIAQIFGIGAMLSLYLVYQQKERRKLVTCKLAADLCWVVHYLCLGAYGGMIPNFVGIFRELVFMRRQEKKWASLWIWPAFFICVNWALGITTFHSAVNCIPIIASTFVTLSLWCKNAKLTKLISVPVSCAFLVYDFFVGSWIGMINESIALFSIAFYFGKNLWRNRMKQNEVTMLKEETLFADDFVTPKQPIYTDSVQITDCAAVLEAATPAEEAEKGSPFAEELRSRLVSDFQKDGDLMVHVSSFAILHGVIYMTYYANKTTAAEDPAYHEARMVFCPADELDNKTFLVLQSHGDTCGGKPVDALYDTILMPFGDDTLFLLWTAKLAGNYYRLYRTFTISTKTLSGVKVNRFQAGNIANDFSITGIQSALTENGIPFKQMYSDIGIMQKLSSRVENGQTYYYSGAYSGDFNCIIRSRDLITWQYVAQPDFPNLSKWENATYVIGSRCYYFVRQRETAYGFLTAYDLEKKTWDKPVLISDCQSRSDFILYHGRLFLFHAPVDRNHLGIVKIDTENLAGSTVVLQADIGGSCFYPFIQYAQDDPETLYLSYTVSRQKIRLAKFDPAKFLV